MLVVAIDGNVEVVDIPKTHWYVVAPALNGGVVKGVAFIRNLHAPREKVGQVDVVLRVDWLYELPHHVVNHLVIEPRPWTLSGEAQEVHLKAVLVDERAVNEGAILTLW